jgi:RNA polymerase sigma factor (TIGR02999 family)
MNEAAPSTEITVLLRQWQVGDAAAYDRVIEWAYQHMLAIASGYVARERLATEPASLVSDAWLRLRELRNMEWRDRHHFFSFVATQMRRILIDHARIRIAQKREGNLRRVPMSDDLSWIDVQGRDMLDLDRALNELESIEPARVRLVELRYVMGCTVPEIAELSGASDATVERHLRFARTWLFDKLRPHPV